MKVKAYSNTKVDYVKSQMQINSLLNINNIYEIQHTLQGDKATITFIKELEVEGRKVKVGVKVTLPNMNERNRNQLYRALFHYLKSKFESLAFGFVEEYNEAFVKEFMPYLVTDKQGHTIADVILPRLNESLLNTNQGEQLYLEDNYKEKKMKNVNEVDFIDVGEKQ